MSYLEKTLLITSSRFLKKILKFRAFRPQSLKKPHSSRVARVKNQMPFEASLRLRVIFPVSKSILVNAKVIYLKQPSSRTVSHHDLLLKIQLSALQKKQQVSHCQMRTKEPPETLIRITVLKTEALRSTILSKEALEVQILTCTGSNS